MRSTDLLLCFDGVVLVCFFFFQAEDGIRDYKVTGVQTCALPICQLLVGSRTLVKLDLQGRLALPKHLRDWSGIAPNQSAVIIGQGKMLEIWRDRKSVV